MTQRWSRAMRLPGNPREEPRSMNDEHFCDARLPPGACALCAGRPRPTVGVISWARTQWVEVEILGRTPRRIRIRFLADSMKGRCGDVRLVHPSVVRAAR